jgi:hypothetical protein
VAELTGVIPASARMNAVLVPIEGCEDIAQWDNAEDEDLATLTTLLADHEGIPDGKQDSFFRE